MSEPTPRHPMTFKPAVLALPGMDAVTARRGIPYRDSDPLTLVNHAGAPHAFDLLDDREPTRSVIRGILGFLRAQLG